MPERRRCAGFTLVEILVALTLMGLILGSLYSGLFGVSRIWSRAEVHADDNDRLRISTQLLQRLIGAATPILHVSGQKPSLLFQGERDQLRWVAPLPSHAGGAGLYWTELSVGQSAGQTSHLVLTYSPLTPDRVEGSPSEDQAADAVVLDENAHSIKFQYFGSENDNQPSRWHPQWPEAGRLPLAIRVTTTARSGATSLPELVIALHMTAQRGQAQWMLYSTGGVTPQ